MQEGATTLAAVAGDALYRLLEAGVAGETPARLFTDEERERLAEALAATNATAELLGRSRIRRRQEKAQAAETFADDESPFSVFDDGTLEPMAPNAALDYFTNLVPTLGTDPQFDERQRRTAFTLAVATDEALLKKAQEIIARYLETGDGAPTAAVTLPDGTTVGYIQHRYGAMADDPSAYELVLVDPAAFDKAWSKDRSLYIPPGGGGAEIEGRRSGVLTFLATGAALEASFVELTEDGTPGFTDGRHRYSVLRDEGADAIALTVPAEQADEFRRLFPLPDDSEAYVEVPTAEAELGGLLERAGVSPNNPAYAETVFRTNMMDAYNEGATAELQDPDVADFFPVWRYVGIADGRERDSHREHFDKYFLNATSFAAVRDSVKGEFDGFNCVLPGATVGGRTIGASKAFYAGEAVEIVTAGGRRLAVTPNHPVLTGARGFCRAADLREGMDLLCYGVRLEGADPDQVENPEALIEEVFRSLEELAPVGVAKRPSPLDFHGDGAALQGEIYVVRTNGLLRNEVYSELRKAGLDYPLQVRDVAKTSLPGGSPFHLYFQAVSLAASGVVGLGDLASAGGGVGPAVPLQPLGFALVPEPYARFRHLSGEGEATEAGVYRKGIHGLAADVASDEAFHVQVETPELRRLGPAAELDARLAEPAGHCLTLDTQLAAELLRRFPGKVTADQIVEIRRFHYEGPVYDLETDVGYFVANHAKQASSGIVIANCRCTTIPIFKDDWAELQKAGNRIAEGWA